MLAPRPSEISNLLDQNYSQSFRNIYKSVLKKLENRQIPKRSTTTTSRTEVKVKQKVSGAIDQQFRSAPSKEMHSRIKQPLELPAIYRLNKQKKFEKQIEDILRKVAETPFQGERRPKSRSKSKIFRPAKQISMNKLQNESIQSIQPLLPWASYE